MTAQFVGGQWSDRARQLKGRLILGTYDLIATNSKGSGEPWRGLLGFPCDKINKLKEDDVMFRGRLLDVHDRHRSCPNSSLFNLLLPLQTLPFSPSLINMSLPWPLSRFSPGRAVNPVVNPTRKPSSIASLLRFYETPGIPPPSSRVDPLLQQRGGHVMGLRDLLSLGGLIALKGE